jgi:GT2 family glycosyltransferase
MLRYGDAFNRATYRVIVFCICSDDKTEEMIKNHYVWLTYIRLGKNIGAAVQHGLKRIMKGKGKTNDAM